MGVFYVYIISKKSLLNDFLILICEIFKTE